MPVFSLCVCVQNAELGVAKNEKTFESLHD
jgi:hypothetical protein